MMETNNPWDALTEPAPRLPRSLETRETATRKRSWEEPSKLPVLPERPGWKHKWVRTDINATPDKTHAASKFREGWEPIDLAEYPELRVFADGKDHGRVEVGGLIACRMPEEMVQQRNDHYRGVAKQQESDAEEHYFRDDRELKMKKFKENSRKVMFGPNAR